jgi:D-aspartate ligase
MSCHPGVWSYAEPAGRLPVAPTAACAPVSRSDERAPRAERPVPQGSAGSSIGAVVIGGDYVGLGIVRSLGARGIPVCVVDDEPSISRFSRYTTHAVRVRSVNDGARTVDALLELERRLKLRGWVLIPTRDETVAALSRHRSLLAERFRVPSPSWDTFRWAWDKRNSYDLARRLGIPAPRTWSPRSDSELEAIDCEPPFVIKPAVRARFLRETKKKAWRVERRDELATRFREARRIAGHDPIMVQELIPGLGERQYAYCALFKHDHPVGSMVARRVRQHPMDFGRASTFVETVDLPELEVMSNRFLQAINYYGLVEIEYKLDARVGQYKLLDFNARHWGYHSLGVGAGVDFSYLLYADQVGIPTRAGSRARAGVTWTRFLTDAPVATLEVLRGRLKLSAYLRSLRLRDVEAVFSRTDMKPGVAELALFPYLCYKRGF